jgi:hypothetical protein
MARPRKRISRVADLPPPGFVLPPAFVVVVMLGYGGSFIASGGVPRVLAGSLLLLAGVLGPLVLLAAYLRRPLED